LRALVTGAAGFVGQWLCGELLRRGWEVTGARLERDAFGLPGAPSRSAALSAEEGAAVRWLACDVTRPDDIIRSLDNSRPDAIFHLAGVSFLPQAGADPGAALEVNAVAAARLLSAVRTRKRAGELDPVVLIVGSGEQYGAHPREEQPLSEGAEQRPINVYAASKAAQEVVSLEAFRSDGVRVIATRSFNHSGAGQSARFVIPALVRRALALHASGGRVLSLGNISPVRDFLHVVDVVSAYILLAVHGVPGEVYNVSSGQGVDIGTLAERILALAGADATLEVDPSLVRPVDVPVLIGSAARLRAATGWKAERSLDTIIEDVIRAAPR